MYLCDIQCIKCKPRHLFFNIVPIQALSMDDNEFNLVGFSILLNSNKMSLGVLLMGMK